MRDVVSWSEATERLRGHLQCIHFQILLISDFTHKLIVVCCVLENKSSHVIGTYGHLYVFCHSWGGWVYLQYTVPGIKYLNLALKVQNLLPSFLKKISLPIIGTWKCLWIVKLLPSLAKWVVFFQISQLTDCSLFSTPGIFNLKSKNLINYSIQLYQY